MTQDNGGQLLKAFIDVRRCFQHIYGQSNLTQGEFLVLRRIKIEQEGGGVLGQFKAVQISNYLSMPPPAVSRIFNSLENQGLIERKINKENRRSVIVSLTKKGQQQLSQAEAKFGAIMGKLWQKMGKDNCEKLQQLLEQVAEILTEEN